MNPRSPTWWHQGTLDGRMLGLLDFGCLYLGEPAETTNFAFGRPVPGEPFAGRDFTGRPDNPILKNELLLQELSKLSPTVTSVQFLDAAVEARFEWKNSTPEGLASDARVLLELLKAAGAP